MQERDGIRIGRAPRGKTVRESDGLLCAFVLNGAGGGRRLDWTGIHAWQPDHGILWVHLDRTGAQTREWVESQSVIDAAAAESLLNAQGNRPRVSRVGDALVVMLRGLNRSVGEHAHDMPDNAHVGQSSAKRIAATQTA